MKAAHHLTDKPPAYRRKTVVSKDGEPFLARCRLNRRERRTIRIGGGTVRKIS